MKHGFFGRYCCLMLLAALSAAPLHAQNRFHSRCGADVHVDRIKSAIPLPQGNLFCPLTADPKSAHSYLSYLSGDFATIANPGSGAETNIGSIGLGDTFGLLRVASRSLGNGVQLDLVGAIFAQFNLDTESFDLINADYEVGLPVTFRANGFSSRLRLYHQSSHLGDEFLLSRHPERENISFEAIELLLSAEVGALRVYGGGEYYFHERPVELVPRLAHGGMELRPIMFGAGRLVTAVDVKAVDQEEWTLSVSARGGLEIARSPSPGHPARILALLFEYYDGSAPYGQFYRDNIRFYGVGLHFWM